MRKKSGVKPKFAVVLALAIVLVLLYYGYQAEWFKNVGGDNVGAVSASVSSTSGKLVTGAKAVSSSTSSPQPVITVTSWPTFEMKLDSAGNENNLVVKTEYSVTAKNGKIYLPINWGTMSIKNTLDQYAWPKTIETKSLDPVSVVYCGWGSSCYEIPKDKTVRFISRQVYNPLIMFGGVYTAKLDWLYFSLGASDTDFYFKPFPTSTSKLNSMTVVGEKSPYINSITSTSTNNAILPANNFFINGVRFTGSSAYAVKLDSTVVFPLRTVSVSTNQIIAEFSPTALPGIYTIFLKNPTYGESNKFNIELSRPIALKPAVKILSPNGGETLNSKGTIGIKYWAQGLVGKTVKYSLYNYDTGLRYVIGTFVVGYEGNDATAFAAPWLPVGNRFKAQIESVGVTPVAYDESDSYISVTEPKPLITFISSDESVNVEDGNDDDTGTFTIKYRVEAVGGTIYVSDSPSAMATVVAPSTVVDGKGVLYVSEDSGVVNTSDLAALVTFTTSDGASDMGVINGVRLDEGESSEFTLTVVKSNNGDPTDDGLYRVLLKGIGWATSDTPNFQIYRYGLENYKTDPVSLN